MNLELEETQGMIQKTAHDFFSAELPADDLRKIFFFFDGKKRYIGIVWMELINF